MEHDMYQEILDCQWIKDKIRNSNTYAQNMYAAMCNMQWQKRDVMPILKDELWSCSWRSAGGKMAEIRGGGEDYMDYYCSGIRNVDYDEEINKTWDEKGFASEGEVTDEIRHDLGLLGWQPVPYDDKDLV